MITKGTVRYDLLKYASTIINGRGQKALWISGDIIASGDQEDLPLPAISDPWREVSEVEAWEASVDAIPKTLFHYKSS